MHLVPRQLKTKFFSSINIYTSPALFPSPSRFVPHLKALCHFFRFKCIGNPNLHCYLIVQGHPEVLISIIFELDILMLDVKFQGPTTRFWINAQGSST